MANVLIPQEKCVSTNKKAPPEQIAEGEDHQGYNFTLVMPLDKLHAVAASWSNVSHDIFDILQHVLVVFLPAINST